MESAFLCSQKGGRFHYLVYTCLGKTTGSWERDGFPQRGLRVYLAVAASLQLPSLSIEGSTAACVSADRCWSLPLVYLISVVTSSTIG